MAVTANSTATSGVAAAASVTFSHTVNAGTNTRLLVGSSARDGVATFDYTTVTFNADAMTILSGRAWSSTNFIITRIAHRAAPDVVTGDVVVTTDSGAKISAGARAYDGCDQTTAFTDTDFTNDTTANTSESIVLTSAAGEICFANIGVDAASSDILSTTPSTELWENNSGTNFDNAGQDQAGASSVTMEFTWTNSGDSAMSAVAIKAAAAAATVAPLLTLLGVGT